MDNIYTHYTFVHEAILFENIDPNTIDYESKHPFYIKALVPLESESGENININKSYLMNIDTTWVTTTYTMTSEQTIDLYIPKYILMGETDIIPKGTKFIVAFLGGNINKPQIIGRCYE